MTLFFKTFSVKKSFGNRAQGGGFDPHLHAIAHGNIALMARLAEEARAHLAR